MNETQRRLDRLNQLKTWQRTGEKFVSDDMIAQAEREYGWALANDEAIARAEQQRRAQADAQAAAHKKLMDERAIAAQEAYLERRRRAFRGTEAQWEAMKPRILEEYLLGGGDEPDRGGMVIGF